MSHKFNPENKAKLQSEWRKKNLPPIPTLEELGLLSEDTVADLGCGIGYFTIPAAEIISSTNRVFALDTSEEMLTELEERASIAGFSNVISIKTEEYDLKLPNESVSFALLVNVLHEIEDKERFLKEANRIVKSKGRIALVDWEKKRTEMGPPIEHRISLEEVMELLTATGFEVSKEHHLADIFYGIVAVKNEYLTKE